MTTTTSSDHNDHNNDTGEMVRVVMVPRQHAKRVKTSLEEHQLLNRNFRISNTVVGVEITSNTSSGGRCSRTNENETPTTTSSASLVAIPISNIRASSREVEHPDDTTNHTSDTNNDNDNSPQHDSNSNIETLISNIILHLNTSVPQQQLIDYYQFGHQFCPYSSRILGNHNNNQRHYQNCNVVESTLIHAISTFLSNTTTPATTSSTTMDRHFQQQLYYDVTTRLNSDVCPSKLEMLGDDRTIVLPRNALQYKDLPCYSDDDHNNNVVETTTRDAPRNAKHSNDGSNNTRTTVSFRELLLQYGISTTLDADMVNLFLRDYLWTEMARAMSSHRIVRRDEIHPDSPIRQSHYQIVWYDPKYYYDDDDDSNDTTPESHDRHRTNTTNNIQNELHTTAPQKVSSCHWITVTEQGIRQSFDMTKVMFSRGNISEKIRYGMLVQTDELVLDMYAGIGYFTLPALIYGPAKHVYCCEWNPDAIAALKYNLLDNHVSDRVTIFEGDCRSTIQRDHPTVLQNRFDRVCLGLLPSSEGGWSSAILALRKDIGGWLHVHGNVPPKEVHQWSQWLSQSLHRLLLGQTTSTNNNDEACYVDYSDWIVLVVHVEKVKSFAPNVNHYVADVFIGPRPCFPGNNAWPTTLSPDCFQQCWVDHPGGCIAAVVRPDRKCMELCPTTVATPPSCALSPDGPLHHTWMTSPF